MGDFVLWYDPDLDAYTVRSGYKVEEVGPVTVGFIKALLESNADLRESLEYLLLTRAVETPGVTDASS